ncbi:TIR domain-containing protein [Rhizobium lentis]|uniref:toll/interleukin-1 receptor domain-containing protein n=1 Tax=Rhizobium lentis TaxID=1138194 RepID=UPI001C82984F|nr:toll/interleukin-1 receptor domain-containing protein [Rhizobium lentis]MBX5070506.1 TIR domain-containing protein [Rhizobium lentis]MBX5104241.1 TIR domain-containing protein [Rhizobium lentis]
MTPHSQINGTIFLSHANEDKDLVNAVYERLDASSTFFDIRTMEAGQLTIGSMESGVDSCAVFVLFHSKNSDKTWVNFEKEQARISVIAKGTKVLVIPVGGESYKTLPPWMASYMTADPSFSVNDIARTVTHLQHEALEERFGDPEVFVGREKLLRRAELDVLTAPAKIGRPIQHLVLCGLPGMGRTATAKRIVAKTFSSMRPAGPVFELPDMAEAVDLYLRLKEDLDGVMSKEQLAAQTDSFQRLAVEQQVEFILSSLKHWADLNQVVTLKTRWGLRDRTRKLKPWLEKLFEKSNDVRNLRVFYISERKLPPEEIAVHPAVIQYEIENLMDDDINYILSKKIDPRKFDPINSAVIAEKIRGHPATAGYVSLLTNSGMSLESINSNPEPIYSFQDKVLGGIFSGNTLSNEQLSLISLLGWFPKLPISVIQKVFPNLEKKHIAEELWTLSEYSLVQLGDGGYYNTPPVVSSKIKRELQHISNDIFNNVANVLKQNLIGEGIETQLVDSLLISVLESEGEIPDEILSVVTSSSLLSLLQEQFLVARSSKKDSSERFSKIYKLSKIAFSMNTSDDAVEQILFTGGDSAIRSGQYPNDIIEYMERKALPSVYYLIGSHAFYTEKDYDKAAKNLEKALSLKHFRTRNTRLLAKAYIRSQKFAEANESLGKLPEPQLFRDSGLLVLKIRALRGMRLNKDADDLERKLAGIKDEHGSVSLYMAGRAIREGRFNDAQTYITKAEASPQVNQLSVALLQCAILVENGDATALPQTVEMAIAAGRQYDAWQLQARMALFSGDWKAALDLLGRIHRKDFFDLAVEYRALQLKKADSVVSRDVVALEQIRLREEEIARLSVNAPENFRDA